MFLYKKLQSNLIPGHFFGQVLAKTVAATLHYEIHGQACVTPKAILVLAWEVLCGKDRVDSYILHHF